MSAVPATVRSDEQRARVLDAAMHAIAELGAERVTIRELGRRTGMSPGHILYYFGSRDRILVETLRWSEADLGERRRKALVRIDDPRRRVTRWVELALPTGRGDVRWSLWMQIAARPPSDRRTRALLEELGDTWIDDLAAILGQGAAAGAFSLREPARDLAERLSTLTDGLSLAVLLGLPGRTRASALRAASDWCDRELTRGAA